LTSAAAADDDDDDDANECDVIASDSQHLLLVDLGPTPTTKLVGYCTVTN